jgi:hypothetical protein
MTLEANPVEGLFGKKRGRIGALRFDLA